MFAFAEDFPVDVANLIPGNVWAVLLEFHTETLVRGAMQSGTKSFNDALGQDLVVRQASQVLGVQVIRDRGHEAKKCLS